MLKTFFMVIDNPYAYHAAKTGQTFDASEEDDDEKLEGWDMIETDFH